MNKKFQAPLAGIFGCLCFGFAVHLVEENVSSVVTIRQKGLPLLAELPVMERRAQILEEQLELSELQAALRVGSPDEQVRAYVLPAGSPVERFVTSFTLIADRWRQAGLIGEVSAVETGAEQTLGAGLSLIPVRFKLSVNEQGAAQLRQFLLLSGRLTVADVLRESEISALFERVEADNPTGIVPLEQFLSTDLLDYTQDAKAFEDALNRAIAQPLFSSLLTQLSEQSALRDARDIFGGDFGGELRKRHLWPLPLATLQELSLQRGRAPGWWEATVTAGLYRRTDA